MSPEVTVVIPTRDRRDRLLLALRSALRQTDVDVEVVVVDDGSTDPVEDVVRATDDARLRLVRRERPGGVSVARNDGMACASGAWIAFLDDDDLWAPSKLARQLAALRADDRRWAYAGEIVVDAELRVIGGEPPPPPGEVVRLLDRHNAVPAGASNVIASADLLDRVGGFDPALTTSEDWDMWIRLARDGLPASVRDGLVAVTIHPGGASRNVPKMLDEVEIVAARYDLPLDRVRHLRWAAWMALVDGRRVEAARHYARAVAAGDAASIGRAAAALVVPSLARRARRPAPAGTDGWLEEARGWLEALATG
jgi:glycosyltransferase involved in cell wall biosynthesis